MKMVTCRPAANRLTAFFFFSEEGARHRANIV